MEQVNQLKAAFYNYGLRIQAGVGDTGGKAKLKKWMEDANNREALLRYIDTVFWPAPRRP